jgi:osmoprotectant transport system substrate-binding protein
VRGSCPPHGREQSPCGSLVSMRTPIALLVFLSLAGLAACAMGGQSTPEEDTDPVRVAFGPDAETELLGHVLAQLLEAEELEAELVPFSGAEDSRQALELGAVDVRVGYTGEAWLEVLGRADPPGDPRDSVAEVYAHDLADGIVWLRPRFGDGPDEPPANATFAFAVMGPPGADADLRTVSELATRLSEEAEARVCVDEEFGSRSDGLRAVLQAYSVRSDRPFLAASPEEAVLGVAAGDCLAGLTTTTDGHAWRSGLQTLTDDLHVFPAFVPLPQVRAEAVEEHPGLRSALTPLSTELTTTLLGRSNAAVAGGAEVEEIAAELVTELRRRAGRDVEGEEA